MERGEMRCSTDAFVTAEILSYSRALGLFAGVFLNGATLREDRSTNRSLYSRDPGTRDIVRGDIRPTSGPGPLISALNKVAGEGGRARQQVEQ